MKREDQLALKKVEYEGKVYPSNRFGDVKILEYKNNKQVVIMFLNTGFIKEESTGVIRSGHIRDSSLPTTCGFGYIDIEGASAHKHTTKEYLLWNNMINRCYNEKVLIKYPTYRECSVDDRWKYLSCFKEWCNKQVGFGNDGWHLDKDIIVKDSKMYSPETCCFVPPEINCALAGNKRVRGAFPQGVIYNYTKTRYRARIQRGNKWESLGTYDTPEEAFQTYKPVKEAHIKSLAEKWKDQIDIRVYEALMNWTVEITD